MQESYIFNYSMISINSLLIL